MSTRFSVFNSHCLPEDEFKQQVITATEDREISRQPVNKELDKLLQEYVDIFDKNEPVGKFAGEKFRIKLKSDTPIRRPPYRHPRWKRDIINEQVKELLANGSIRESDSPYGSPVTTALKADGTHRLVIDVRELNKVTVDDIEPMPNIDDIVEDTVHSRFFTK
ncbi:uncharacterized protein B4U80_02282, partial [Leptotrombidium deliense]